MIGLALAVLILGGMVYVRLSPMDPARWHQPVEVQADQDLPVGAVRVLAGGDALFRAIDQQMRALPRTQVLAGSVKEGRVTYVTRSAVFGFPDATTVELRADEVRIFGRLRFGASDLGVNRKRLEGLIAAVQGG
ncbi:DUF1499 domain-containing protein [uncultured Roseobacter sp.]|uniref:DUF1499 domain-containing protein n=1 Tax=uncultured Roseobacter sp. TaxID=114847 RepID=UPI003443A931